MGFGVSTMAIDREKWMDKDEVKQLRTVTEARAIVDLRKGNRGGVITWMVVDAALSTGLRVSELAKLQISDVDFKRGALKIERVKKKKKKRETMAIGKDLLKHLKEYIQWLENEEDNEEGPLFPSSSIRPLFGPRNALTAQGLQQIWKQAIKLARLPKTLSIHAARHTCAVHLLRKTGNLRLVQKQLGHASPTTTANLYADVAFEDMQDGLNGLYDDE